MLAVMDHNYHKERDVATTLDGNPYVQGQVSRRTKMWVAYERRKVKEFSYIPDLIAACMLSTYGKSIRSFTKSTKAQELETVSKNLSGKANPGSSQLLDQMRSRKKQIMPP
nr:uncharacterized protein LOC111130442 [Crassostrea virginica]